jgi:hypothetical protein
MEKFEMYDEFAEKVKEVFKRIVINLSEGVSYHEFAVLGISRLGKEEPQLVLSGPKFIPLSIINVDNLI